MKIKYFEESGKQGGWEGMEVDFKKRMIYPSHSKPERFSIDNAESIVWVVDGCIKETKADIKRMTERLAIKKETRIPIPGGYKLVAPPSDNLKEILNEKIKLAKEKLAELKSLNVLKIVKEK